MTSVEINNNQLTGLTSVYKVVKINLDVITFERYEINKPVSSLTDDKKSIIELGKKIGEETHLVSQEVICGLAGNTGMIIKGFRVSVKGKTRKKIVVTEVDYL